MKSSLILIKTEIKREYKFFYNFYKNIRAEPQYFNFNIYEKLARHRKAPVNNQRRQIY